MLQTATFAVVEDVALTVSINVAKLSHPPAFIKVAVFDPAALNVSPFQMYGNCNGHTLILVVLLVFCFTVKFKIAVESHPTEFDPTNFFEYVPVVLYETPFQLYGSVFTQTATIIILKEVSFIVKFKNAVESQPTEFAPINFVWLHGIFHRKKIHTLT